MRRIALPFLFVVAVAVAASARVAAGGWATVRLDESVTDVAVGVPFGFGFTVRQHDIRPMNVERARVFARAQDGGGSIMADAKREGGEGHYVAELTLPTAGGWKWGVAAEEPWGEMAFETLTVSAAGSSSSAASGRAGRPVGTPAVALLAPGKCADRSLEAASSLASIPLSRGAGPAAGVAPASLSSRLGGPVPVPVDQGASTMAVRVDEIASTPHALLVVEDGPEGRGRIACGDVGGELVGDELAIGLAEEAGSGYAGLGVLRRLGERTALSVYVMPFAPAFEAPSVEVTIDDDAFSPPVMTVPVGTTVTWRNAGTIAHTVTGNALAFDDSAVLDPDQRFAQTFDAPGTYEYVCGPHPSMTGTITVT